MAVLAVLRWFLLVVVPQPMVKATVMAIIFRVMVRVMAKETATVAPPRRMVAAP